MRANIEQLLAMTKSRYLMEVSPGGLRKVMKLRWVKRAKSGRASTLQFKVLRKTGFDVRLRL